MRTSFISIWLIASMAFGQSLSPPDREVAGAPTEQEDDTFKVFPDPEGKEYFPKESASYYTRYLSTMKEPSVKSALEKGVVRVYRFTYLRSFHDPLVVRITDTGDKVTARAVRLKMDREYRPVKIIHDETWNLNDESAKTIKTLLEQKDFWTPLNATEKAVVSGGCDGSRWIFEIHDKDGYRMIDIWSPDSFGKITDEQFKNAGIDRTKLRDFLVYRKSGIKVLELGKILPEPDARY